MAWIPPVQILICLSVLHCSRSFSNAARSLASLMGGCRGGEACRELVSPACRVGGDEGQCKQDCSVDAEKCHAHCQTPTVLASPRPCPHACPTHPPYRHLAAQHTRRCHARALRHWRLERRRVVGPVPLVDAPQMDTHRTPG